MLFILLFAVLTQFQVTSATLEEESLPWGVQTHINTRAQAYNAQCANQTMTNLKDDLDLWSLLVFNKICNRKENTKSVAWVLETKNIIAAEIEVLGFDLAEYRTNITLYENRFANVDNIADFMQWLTTTPHENIVGVLAWALHLERRDLSLKQLYGRLSTFYDSVSSTAAASKEGTIAFVLAEPGDMLGALLAENEEETRAKVEQYITNIYFPISEDDEDPDDMGL